MTEKNGKKKVSEMVENIVGKGENAGHQQFLLFRQFFQKGFIFKVLTHYQTKKKISLSKSKAFAVGKIKVTDNLKFDL